MVAAKAARFRALSERLVADNASPGVMRRRDTSGTPWQPGAGADADTAVEYVPTKRDLKQEPDSLAEIDLGVYLISPKANVRPEPGDRLALVAIGDIAPDTRFHEIMQVKVVELGQTDLLYKVWVEN